MLLITEKANRMLKAGEPHPDSKSYDMPGGDAGAYHRAMLSPHMDFISRQMAFDAPIQWL